MTTPVTSRIPTPGDLAALRPAPKPTAPAVQRTAHRPAAPTAEAKPKLPARPRLSAEEAIAPGQLKTEEHFRKFFLFGLRRSGMPAHARLVGHDLVWRASHATGRISPNLNPSSEVLAHATGLTTGQVDVALQVLHTRGWLHHRVLQTGPRAGQSVPRLTIPAAALEDIRAWLSQKPATGLAR
ncbi:hypothetical protein [Streptomyces sp. NPDC006355]|uniref:hypothetical protein n=1 Tax=Streptomyces sp. NPDC006355 TaxID=3156758 RepID=UPI0033BB213D